MYHVFMELDGRPVSAGVGHQSPQELDCLREAIEVPGHQFFITNRAYQVYVKASYYAADDPESFVPYGTEHMLFSSADEEAQALLSEPNVTPDMVKIVRL